MRHCFLCDAGIAGSALRRTVQTGSTSRVSVGRRVSASSGQRRGLRTVCQACANDIDQRNSRSAFLDMTTRRVLGGAAVAVVGFVIYASSHGGRDLPRPSRDDIITPAHAASTETSFTPARPASRNQPLNGYVPIDPTPSNPAPTVTAMNSIPLQVPSSTAEGVPNHPPVPWRHVTSNGTHWSLRRMSADSMLLVVELGGDQVANITVAPAFEALDLPAMNQRVDYIRTTVGQSFSLRTASYSYGRDGTLRQAP